MKFLKSVRSELKKVKWADKQYMLKYTIATLAMIVFFAAYFTIIQVVVAALKELI